MNEAAPPAVLIANRGEVALRIRRSASAAGHRTIAIFSEEERGALHVKSADDAVALPGTGPAAYLDVERVVAAAVQAGAELVHPGWGFLSESPELTRRCAEEGIGFVGPSPEVMELLGDKVASRQLALDAGVPVLAALADIHDDEAVARFLVGIDAAAGVMVKAAGGGGGRGMRVVTDPTGLPQAIARARSESLRSFGSDAVYLERYVPRSRHIEVQIVGDGQRWVSLGLRDCSVQRRHQKVVEVAPPVGLDFSVVEALEQHAVRLCGGAGVVGLVTAEFLLDLDREGEMAFIEANPRLQVEHGITEALTGLDLVGLQLGLAQGALLSDLGVESAPPQRGVALEARVVQRHSEGRRRVTTFRAPSGDGLRVDTHVVDGYQPPEGFDPLLAKVIVHREDGAVAAAAGDLRRALHDLVVDGIDTDKDELADLVIDPLFLAGELTTAWLDGREGVSQPPLLESLSGPFVVVLAPVSAPLVAVPVAIGDLVRRGQSVAVLEAMKLEHDLVAPVSGRVVALAGGVGDTVASGAPVVTLQRVDVPDDPATETAAAARADIEDVRRRHAAVSDAQRPEAVARRHARGQRTARENVADLCEPGTFREYGPLVIAAQRSRRSVEELERETPADGVVAGFGALRGAGDRTIGVLAFDYTVLAGTQGLQGHKKAERVFELARRRRTPVVVFAEGGGGRPGDVDNLAKATGMDLATFVALGRLNGRVPTAAVVTGRCFAGNAAMAGACDLVVATRGSNLGMGGPAMIEGGGLGRHLPEEVGPAEEQAHNGVVDVLVDDEVEATEVVRRYLAYFAGPGRTWSSSAQEALRDAVPEARRRHFDVRSLIETLCDCDSTLELRRDFGPAVITVMARIEGRPVGVVANDASHQGGAIDSAAADKMARFLQLCDAHALPVVSLCDTPGFLVGPDAEREATVRHVSRLFVLGPNLEVPLCTVVVRRAYGMGGQAMAGGGFRVPDAIVAWPTATFGAMGPEGAVRLAYRRELDAIDGQDERESRFQELVADYVVEGSAVNAASVFEIDDVIDPADTRTWVVQTIDAYDWSARGCGARRIDTW